MKKYLLILLFIVLFSVFSLAQDEPISLTATASQISPFVGQTFVVSVSVINTAYEDISGFLLAKGASGITVYSIEAMSGTSNQWSSGEIIFPGKGGQEEIKFNAVGNEAIEAPIEIIFNYKYQGKERQIKTTLGISIKEPKCGDSKCEHTESSENCCEDCACLKNYECEKHGDDVKPRCYRKSKIKAFFDYLLGLGIMILVIYVVYKIVKKKYS